MQETLAVNIFVPEYPGYGIYDKNNAGEKLSASAEIIEVDAMAIWKHFTEKLKIPTNDIIIIGKSIGTGPAI